ncbi:energy transducer TonB [Draconibacterium halophilum]|uniref:Energy transducer TonB n=1 Tax=Draconibacterium halophilum TaxID=2706887 RepID=A0A6C0RCK3_9BACT|nr:energy transducer TonB [Draconibacterium halophilum]QIA08214.1 energy transducer TonB [Draconibacterium halophilum]
MEVKKAKKADLEKKRNTFFLIGLVVALSGTLLAFEWTTKPSGADSLGVIETMEVEEEFIPVTREQEIKPPPPPPPPKVVEVLNIVDDEVEIENELEIEDSEADEETVIDIEPLIEAAEEKEDETDKIFIIVEEPAEFPGGTRALYQYISNNVRYPVVAQENGIEGTVYLKFVVDEQGKVSGGEVLRHIDPSLDKEALRVINSLPRFKPGKQRGKPVKVYYNAKITFDLQ